MNGKDDELHPEYPTELIESGVRGKYAARYRKEGSNVALIGADLLKVFPDSEAVNRALRDYIDKKQSAAN